MSFCVVFVNSHRNNISQEEILQKILKKQSLATSIIDNHIHLTCKRMTDAVAAVAAVEESPAVEVAATNIDVGLTASEVESLREKWGWNEIPTPTTPTYVLFLRQFTGFLSIIIMIAAIVAIAVVDYADFIVIVCMLFVNGTYRII